MATLLHHWRRLVAAIARASVKHETLRDLDDRTLKDIGVFRHDIPAIEAVLRRQARRPDATDVIWPGPHALAPGPTARENGFSDEQRTTLRRCVPERA